MIPGVPCTPFDTPHFEHACMMRSTPLPTSSCRWLLNSGASNHYTSNRDYFITFDSSPPIPIETAGGIVYGCGRGDILLPLTCGTIRISNVIHVPSMNARTNLISIGQLESQGLEFTFKRGYCYVWKGGSLWAVASRVSNVYVLDELLPDAANCMVSFPVLASPKEGRRVEVQEMEIWHRRLGHLNRKYISTLKGLSEGVEFGASRKYTFDCPDCKIQPSHSGFLIKNSPAISYP